MKNHSIEDCSYDLIGVNLEANNIETNDIPAIILNIRPKPYTFTNDFVKTPPDMLATAKAENNNP
jgi:hypothetical protein